MPDTARPRLLALLRQKSLRIGEFKLSSGKRSSYYFDAKLTTLDPEGAYLCAWMILEKIRVEAIEARAIGGLTLGADPIVAAVAAISFADRHHFEPLAAFIVRKQAKGHGTRRYLEGFSAPPGTPVVIIDDVCTTGGSTIRAIERAEEAGFRVTAVFCLVDRLEGAAEALAEYPFYSLYTSRELLDEPEIQRKLLELNG